MTIERFSPAHLVILATVPAAAWVLARVVRRHAGALPTIRVTLAFGIAIDVLAWYAYSIRRGEFAPPHGLPLELCDVVQWLVVFALLSPRAWALEGAYYLGLGGSGMALITPDIGAGVSRYALIQFFLGHGLVVGTVLFLVWAGALRPRPGSWWRTFIALNAFAVAVGSFDILQGTNYMYLREKPAAGSLLDLLGPWPWYVLTGDAVALLLLWLLHLPFRRNAVTAPRAAPPSASG